MEKLTLPQLEYIISEMKKLEAEHPKATIIYHTKDGEVHITYPLPKNLEGFRGGIIRNGEKYL